MCRGPEKNGMVRAGHGRGMASVNQSRPRCVNQMGNTHSKSLAARHGRRTAWARHAMCESAFRRREICTGLVTQVIYTYNVKKYRSHHVAIDGKQWRNLPYTVCRFAAQTHSSYDLPPSRKGLLVELMVYKAACAKIYGRRVYKTSS